MQKENSVLNTYIRKRLISFIIVLIGVSILSFILITLSNKDPAEIIARRGMVVANEDMIEAVRVELGLNKPIVVQYFNWVKGLFTGDLGISIHSFNPIAQDLKQYFPTSFALVGLSLLWIVIISVPVSLLCAFKRNKLFDKVVHGLSLLGICMPTFWFGFLLLLVFAVNLSIFTVLPEPGIKGLLLPSFTLAVPVISSTVRVFRASLLGEMNHDYVIYAKARGLSDKRIICSHIMRNALPPVVTLFCQYLGYLIAGSAVVESVFSLKGIGSHLIACIMAVDTTTVATCMVIIAAIFVIANLMGDVVNLLLCPWMVREKDVS